MKRLTIPLLILIVVVCGFGFYRGWFAVSGDRDTQSNKVDVNLTVDPDKVKADAATVTDKASELTGHVTEHAKETDAPANDIE